MFYRHRFERTARGDLHIHSRNVFQNSLVLLSGTTCLMAPVALAVLGVANGFSLLAEQGLLASLLIVFGLLLLFVSALFLMLCTATGETLLLSRLDGEGQRRTENFLTRRERARSVFSIQAPKYLELRRRKQAKPVYTQLWLVMRDGTEHRLTTDCFPVLPGSKPTDQWLKELADYLDVAVPTEVVEDSAPDSKVPYKPGQVPKPKDTHNSTGKNNEQERSSAQQATQILSAPVRIFLVLLGIFMAVLELNRVFALVPSLFSGQLRISGYRSTPTLLYWSDQPFKFSFHVLLDTVEVLFIGFVVWRSLSIAIKGKM